jgi:hypothetical protein
MCTSDARVMPQCELWPSYFLHHLPCRQALVHCPLRYPFDYQPQHPLSTLLIL